MKTQYEKYYTNECPDCGNKKYKYAKFCNNCFAKGKRNPNYNKKHSEDTKKKIGLNSGKSRLGKKRKGNIAETDARGRERAERWFNLKPCEICGSNKSERHHKDNNPRNNNPENIMFVCRKHHQEIDGRLKNLKIGLIEIANKRLKPYLEQTKL